MSMCLAMVLSCSAGRSVLEVSLVVVFVYGVPTSYNYQVIRLFLLDSLC